MFRYMTTFATQLRDSRKLPVAPLPGAQELAAPRAHRPRRPGRAPTAHRRWGCTTVGRHQGCRKTSENVGKRFPVDPRLETTLSHFSIGKFGRKMHRTLASPRGASVTRITGRSRLARIPSECPARTRAAANRLRTLRDLSRSACVLTGLLDTVYPREAGGKRSRMTDACARCACRTHRRVVLGAFATQRVLHTRGRAVYTAPIGVGF